MSQALPLDAANAERVTRALKQLHDIVEPVAPSFWPPAPGWYWLGVAALLLVAIALLCFLRRWQANAFRRQALSELAALRDGAQAISALQERISALAMLLRRVALHGAAREQIASLSGDAWIAHLSKQSKTPPSPTVSTLLSRGPYANFAATNELASTHRADLDAVFDYVETWIKQHHVVSRSES